MRILLILLLLLANLMLFGINHLMFGPLPSAGLRNPAPLTRELNPSAMQIRPMAPGEYVDYPVVGTPDPTVKVMQSALPQGSDAASMMGDASGAGSSSAAAAAGASGAGKPVAAPVSAASGTSSGSTGVTAAASAASASKPASTAAAGPAAATVASSVSVAVHQRHHRRIKPRHRQS